METASVHQSTLLLPPFHEEFIIRSRLLPKGGPESLSGQLCVMSEVALNLPRSSTPAYGRGMLVSLPITAFGCSSFLKIKKIKKHEQGHHLRHIAARSSGSEVYIWLVVITEFDWARNEP